LPLRAKFSDTLTFKQLLKQVRETCLDAYSHQDLPFEKLVEELKPERSLYHAPLFQAVFTQENTSSEELSLHNLALTAEEVELETAKFELSLLVKEDRNEMTLLLNYASDLFLPATIERMAGHLRTLLEGIVANPEEHISRLPLLTTSERRQLMDDWNPIGVEWPLGNCLHQLFEAQVERTPEAVALVFEGKQMTYRELNRRATRSRHLVPLASHRKTGRHLHGAFAGDLSRNAWRVKWAELICH
jgi:non-ribosomal peptide synthetase component F